LLSKIEFNGDDESTALCHVKHPRSRQVNWSVAMSNTSTKFAIAILAVMAAAPAASYAQFARGAGSAAAGNVPISGIAPGPANAGGMNNVMVDPSGVGNAARVAAPPPPRISVPVIPKFK
jgi:hypothetical protein